MAGAWKLAMERAEGLGGVGGRTCRLRMPSSFAGGRGKLFQGECRAEWLPVEPLTCEEEEDLVAAIAADLTSQGRAIMAMSFDLDRAPAKGVPKNGRTYLCVGNSTAAAISKFLQLPGESCELVSTQDWRLTEESVAELTARMTAVLATNDVHTVVLAVLDEDMFLGKARDGTMSRAFKSDGTLHVAGSIMMATMRPLLTAAGSRNIIIVAPYPKYVGQKCCDAGDHLTNRQDMTFVVNMKKGLVSAKQEIRAILKTNNIRRGRVLDPDLCTSNLEEEELWGPGPTDVTDRAFAAMAEGVRKLDAAITSQLNVGGATGALPGSGAATSNRGGSSAAVFGGGRSGGHGRPRGGWAGPAGRLHPYSRRY